MSKLRSVGAVVAGIAANFLAVPIDAALEGAGLLSPPGAEIRDLSLAIALGYRIVLAVLGGAVTARLAPSSPRAHALALGVVGLLLSSAGAAAQWDLGHHWYPLCLVATCLPASWAGARLIAPRS